jgi:uncharacterized repeat protein (TIGR03803 family)
MKTRISNLIYVPALVAVLGLMLAGRVRAQTFAILHSFTELSNSPPYGNNDGCRPSGGLILSGNTLYGTADRGGSADDGTVFGVNTDGTGFTNLHSFTGTLGDAGYYGGTNSDGADPGGGLILSGNTLYGMAGAGGSSAAGTVFSFNTNGSGFTNLHSFTNGTDGGYPGGGLIISGDTLYGTAADFGGSGSYGTVFSVETNGLGFRTVHSFTNVGEGGSPAGALVLSGNTLFGTTVNGGSGTVFAVNTNGTGFTNLHSFTGTLGDGGIVGAGTNIDGSDPAIGLIVSGNTLYGTAQYGGSSGNGTVFAVNTNGTGFTNLHSFTGTLGDAGYYGYGTNSDGALPSAGLILSGNMLYGTAQFGGRWGDGTVFAVNTNGTGFSTLYSLTNGTDGVAPNAGLILSANTFYGTTDIGGSSGSGTVFSLSLVQMTISLCGSNVILTWPTNQIGLILQSFTNLASPAVWSTVSPAPVVVNGQCRVTNATSGTQKFYQLNQ